MIYSETDCVILFVLPLLAVIHQDFKVHVPLESYVIRGNDAIIKCEIPSFVGDLVKIFSWVDNSNKEYPADSPLFGKYLSVSYATHNSQLIMTPPRCNLVISIFEENKTMQFPPTLFLQLFFKSSMPMLTQKTTSLRETTCYLSAIFPVLSLT